MNGSFKTMVATALSLSLSLGAAKSFAEMIATTAAPIMGPGSQSAWTSGHPQVGASSNTFETGPSQPNGDGSASQLDNVLSDWNEFDPTTSATGVDADTAAKANTAPQASTNLVVNEVGGPIAGWQILAGLTVTAAMAARMPRRGARRGR